MNNKKIGNEFENELAELLDEKGFWVHLLNQNKSGQPADMIAAINGKAFLIDAKVCSRNTFDLTRIEDNQHTSMQKWRECGNGTGWFALKVDGGIYMVDYSYLNCLLKETNIKKIDLNKIMLNGYELTWWMKVVSKV